MQEPSRTDYQLAQQYLIAHRQLLGAKSKTTVQPRHAQQKKSTQPKSDMSRRPEFTRVLPLVRLWTLECATKDKYLQGSEDSCHSGSVK